MTASWQDMLDRAIERRSSRIVGVRRHLHTYPEPSGEESETTLYLYQALGDEGFDVRQGPEGRGVLADLGGGSGDSSLGGLSLRADIDALRIHDQKEVDYRSQRTGVMHACGHDAHSAILVGTLLSVKDLRDSGNLPWPVKVRGIFQPAEETGQGAKSLIACGALDGVGAILTLHVDPTLLTGRLGIRDTVMTASCDSMEFQILGQGGHAARPHESRDPIAAAAQLISALYLHVPRATDSQDAVVITIGQIVGGDNANVIPEKVHLGGTIRTLDPNVRKQTMDYIRRLARGVALTTSTTIDVTFGMGAPSICNDPNMVRHVRHAAIEVVGEQSIVNLARPSMGSEDFAFYLERVPGAMFRLGCAFPRQPMKTLGLHTPTFDIDERCLNVGVRVLARAAINWFRPSLA